jgi:hypothetical protein
VLTTPRRRQGRACFAVHLLQTLPIARAAVNWMPPTRNVTLHSGHGGRDDILAEAAGIEARAWYASPAMHAGYELVAAGMLIMAGGHEGRPLDYEALERWTRVGYERGMAMRRGER